jgi:hypothetical protein
VLIEAVESADMAEIEFEEHLACQGFVSNHDSPPGGRDEQDILETEKDEETMSPKMLVDTGISEDEDAASSELRLPLEAEAGLREILDQFGLSPTEIDEVLGSFQNFLVVALTDLFLTPIPKANRYVRAMVGDSEQIHEILADVAQQSKALVCNEAATERANSAMKRTLSPFRLKMAPSVLLSRLTIARQGNVEVGQARGSIEFMFMTKPELRYRL